MKKALCVGINYYNTPSNKLNGCIDDVINIKNVLIDAYGYSTQNITVLRDDIVNNPTYLPTRANILSNLKSLVDSSAGCDEIWFHYSGHGSQIADKNGDEVSKLDQVIVPMDFPSFGFITDDELYNIIINAKCKFILLFDSCNSGTVCDLPYTFEYKNYNSYVSHSISNIQIQNQNIFMISGCKDNQTSADAYSGEYMEYIGVFTNAFIAALRMHNHSAGLLVVYRDTCDYIIQNGYSQTPLLSSSNPHPSYTFARPTQQIPYIKTPSSAILTQSLKKIIR